ncbi:MAG: hypothetical protein IK055_10500 [Lachnospiraceae bacterium]|nr:hypothetical protein [Lachnospiraceae bacterium]
MARTMLVIGNGFDLKCGLESSFAQYLDSDYYKSSSDKVKKTFEYVREELNGTGQHVDNHRQLYDLFEDNEISFWDYYFAIPHIFKFSNIVLWHDFETKLHTLINNARHWTSLLGGSGEYYDISSADWKNSMAIISTINEMKVVRNCILHEYMRHFGIEFNDAAFGLMKELKEFEKKFGNYIAEQQSVNKDYATKAESLINTLLGKDHQLAYVSTFNYSDIKCIAPSNCDIWHVNGNTDRPIFGIDLSESTPASSKWYSFTKTYRRLELEGNAEFLPQNKEYTRVVVFGHSLTEQDYSFFYALFNRLNLSDSRRLKNGTTIEFMYSGYEGKPADEARHDTIENVLKLLQSYNKDVLDEKNFHLMDILYCNGILRVVEVP